MTVIAKIVQFVFSDYCGIISSFCIISTISTIILFDFAIEKKNWTAFVVTLRFTRHQALQDCLQKGSTIYISPDRLWLTTSPSCRAPPGFVSLRSQVLVLFYSWRRICVRLQKTLLRKMYWILSHQGAGSLQR